MHNSPCSLIKKPVWEAKMEQLISAIARISGMNSHQIVDLHISLIKEIKAQYKLRANPVNLENTIALCEKSIAISALVIEAMKRKHRNQCDEYARVTGKLSPNSKFCYPGHHPAHQLCVILRKQGNIKRAKEIEAKMKREGWGNSRH